MTKPEPFNSKRFLRQHTIKPDTEWMQKLSCEQRRKFREQKEQELGLPEGSLAYSYDFWEREDKK